jgi:glycosyltransferase involved in cell wall biosynthesis
VMLTSDNEGTPVSLIEAQAAAVPVVSTAVGGVPSAVLDGRTGLLAEAEDETALADAATAILDEPDMAKRLATAGRELASSRYTLERLVDDHDRLYRSLLADRRLSRDRSSPAS